MSLRQMARQALAATALPQLMLRHRTKRLVTVLGYHRIVPPLGPDYAFNESVVSATPEQFARELQYLRKNLDVISIPELLQGLQNPSLLPPRPAVITFDDGYWDNAALAFPLLRDARLPACFFVCTGLIGTREIPWHEAWVCCLKRSCARRIESPFGGDDPPYELDQANVPASLRRFRQQIWQVPWSQVPAYLLRLREATSVNPQDHLSEPLFMSWEAVREMSAAGMDIGGHTRTHPNLARVDVPEAMREEVGGGFVDLTRELGQSPLAFAYPFGYSSFMSEAADQAIERAGFQVSFSFIHGFAPRRTARMHRLPRIHAGLGNDHRAFRLRMAMAPVLGT